MKFIKKRKYRSLGSIVFLGASSIFSCATIVFAAGCGDGYALGFKSLGTSNGKESMTYLDNNPVNFEVYTSKFTFNYEGFLKHDKEVRKPLNAPGKVKEKDKDKARYESLMNKYELFNDIYNNMFGTNGDANIKNDSDQAPQLQSLKLMENGDHSKLQTQLNASSMFKQFYGFGIDDSSYVWNIKPSDNPQSNGNESGYKIDKNIISPFDYTNPDFNTWNRSWLALNNPDGLTGSTQKLKYKEAFTEPTFDKDGNELPKQNKDDKVYTFTKVSLFKYQQWVCSSQLGFDWDNPTTDLDKEAVGKINKMVPDLKHAIAFFAFNNDFV